VKCHKNLVFFSSPPGLYFRLRFDHSIRIQASRFACAHIDSDCCIILAVCFLIPFFYSVVYVHARTYRSHNQCKSRVKSVEKFFNHAAELAGERSQRFKVCTVSQG
jgi:uncharacterized membrane protein